MMDGEREEKGAQRSDPRTTHYLDVGGTSKRDREGAAREIGGKPGECVMESKRKE